MIMKKDFRGKLVMTVLLAVILLGAAFLRLYNLGEESLWLDECFTLDYASKPVNQLVETLKKDVHPIGYYLPQHLLIDHFGSGEVILRMLSVFFGVLSVYLTFILGKKLFSWKEGLLAAFFVSISYTSILYSQEAKMYSMFAAFFLLSLFYFIKFLERPSYFNLVFFSISTTLLLYTHIIGFAILLFYIVFYSLGYAVKQNPLDITDLFFQNKEFTSRFILALTVIFLLYLPWLKILVFYQLPLLYSFLGVKLIEKMGFNLLPFVLIAIIFLTFLCFVSFYLILINKIDLKNFFRGINSIFSFFSKDIILFLLILTFVIIDLLLSNYFFSSVGIIRFVFFALPLFYIILSKVLLNMNKNHLANLLFILLVVSASFELYNYYRIDSKEQFREAAEYIQAEASPADVLFLHRATITKQCFDYYYSGNIEEVRLIVPSEDNHLLFERTIGKRNAYLLLSHNYHTGDYFKSQLGSLYESKEEKKFIGVTIYKYDISES